MKHKFSILNFQFSILLLLLLFTSCEKVIEIDDDPSAAKLVLNGLPVPDQRAFVYFAHTRFFLDPSNDQPVPGAQLTLSVGGVPYAPDSVSRCKYFFPYTLAEGDSLSIDVTTPRGTVHGRTYIPYTPHLTDISIRNHSGAALRYYRAEFTLHDRPDLTEYYNLTVSVRDSGLRRNHWRRVYDTLSGTWHPSIDTIDTVRNTYFLLPSNPEIQGDNSFILPMAGRIYTRNIFIDSAINGQVYPVTLNIINLRDTNEIPPFKHEFTVQLQSLTPACLRYLIDVSRQGSGNNFFAEQGQVRSNLEGALGVFAGSATNQFSFDPDTLPR
ncbi:MAG: DUF4249 domain-containing protein [Bacteroidales bacterium]|nr:DUF4249 domain-containing protein [Bacteroidales bacterium]